MRKCRKYSQTGLYHAINRGNDKQIIFYDSGDFQKYLYLLKKYKNKYEIDIIGYVLMSNHIHLLLDAPGKTISSFMQIVSSLYAKYFNKKYDRIGHLFQGRFLSETIEDDEAFISVFKYIIKNPQKAGISNFDEYKWSNYKEIKKNHSFVNTKPIINILGNLNNLFKFLYENDTDTWMEPSLRPSEKNENQTKLICEILNSKSPIINQELPPEIIKSKILLIRQHGFSINSISRITHLPKRMVKSYLLSNPSCI